MSFRDTILHNCLKLVLEIAGARLSPIGWKVSAPKVGWFQDFRTLERWNERKRWSAYSRLEIIKNLGGRYLRRSRIDYRATDSSHGSTVIPILRYY